MHRAEEIGKNGSGGIREAWSKRRQRPIRNIGEGRKTSLAAIFPAFTAIQWEYGQGVL